MYFTTLIVFTILLISTFGAVDPYANIVVKNFGTPNGYYLTFSLENIDPTLCDDSISAVQIYYQGSWDNSDQYYLEPTGEHRWAWDWKNAIMFDSVLPISVRITMTSGRDIDLGAIITDLNSGSEWVSDQLICDGTRPPTPATPSPTTKSPTPPTTAYPTAQSICIDADPSSLQWRSYGNELKLNGNRFNLKGLSWFGYETGNYGLYGLDVHNEDWYFNWMVTNGFNAMRLPFSQDFIDGGVSNQNAYKATVQKAGEYGIFVFPDYHSKNAGSWTDGLDTVSTADVIATWETMADLLADEWNIIAADAFNEPHDVDNTEWETWITFCEDVATALWDKGVNWMVAVEGTNWQCSEINCAWGENLEGVRNTGVTFDNGENRFIWSPHVYGADVTGNGYSEAGWEAHWGYLVDGTHATNEAASVIGEYGTRYTGDMINWLDDLITYLISIDQRNTFFWCLNPNSGDTGGLLQSDWTTDETDKLTALDRLQPNPSVVVYNSNSEQVCIQFEGGNGPIATPSPVTPLPTATPVNPEPTSAPIPTPYPTNMPTPPPVPTSPPIPTPYPTDVPSPTPGDFEGDPIVIKNYHATQDYYLTFSLHNNDASACGDSVSNVFIYYDGAATKWVQYNQYYVESGVGDRYAFDYQDITFGSMLPISIQILMSSGREIYLWGIITDLNIDSEFTSEEYICAVSNTPGPVLVTPTPVELTPPPTPMHVTTPAPVNVTPMPTPMPTAQPTFSLKVRNCYDAIDTSYKMQLVNFPDDVTLNRVRMRDSNGQNNWLKPVYDSNTGCYVFESGVTPYELPLDIKVRGDGVNIVAHNIITEWSEGFEGDMGTNFAENNSENSNNNGLNQEETNNDKGLSTIEIVAIVLSVIISIGIISILLYCFCYKRNNKQSKTKNSMEMVQQHDAEPKAPQLTTSLSDGNAAEQTNIISVDDDE